MHIITSLIPGFQSTPPRGWRHISMDNALLVSSISIHSTARVETVLSKEHRPQLPGKFQSTPPRGWRPYAYHHAVYYLTFQSTPPRGWRPRVVFNSIHISSFQSTPPRGWRQAMSYKMMQNIHDFNPLHREGGDHGNPIIVPCSNQFQSTPPRGWRHIHIYFLLRFLDFNPLHREGGDH